MSKKKISRVLLSALTVFTTAVSIGVDWNESHVFNPDWVPHAVFHDVMLLVVLVGITMVSLWLIWRRSLEPSVGIRVASALQIVFWGSFYISVWVPGASPGADSDMTPLTLLGLPLYPNMVIAVIVIILALIADWLYHSDPSDPENLSVG